MYWPLTLVGAVAGYALASIPGLLLGGLLGQVLDRRLGLRGWKRLFERLRSTPAVGDEQLLFVMLGRLAKSDGVVQQAHIRQARAEMQRLAVGEAAKAGAIEAFSRGKTGQDNLHGPLQRRRGDADALLRACWRMAWADGRVGQAERELILLWGKWLGVSAAAQDALSAACAPRRGPPTAAPDTYQQALRLLGVNADSDAQQVKKAYRRLLSRHHPDKMAGSGAAPEKVREATEATRELHNAYALIRQRRGFR
ncbi:DnaJ like chaperone protein [Pseudomonas flavescens]|uniref:DnaJ like chaperone protein n=1 Tax=Phytopseudomonas flavescens TaxID=29435 RepID=A0A1G8G502_9GAMM|nr:DnaJ domain-containing protein [Pseudomonas flavescens]SDH89493.1 DnaJ like chaperone protein [Pseudomonas flavescens]